MRTLSLLVVLTCLGPATARAQQRPPLLAGLDAYITKSMTDWRVPGLAIVVVNDDSIVFIKGYGVRELGKPDPVTVHTRFGNMSTTKAFTAMLVAMLADSGRLAFDDPVQKYEPAVQFADPYVTREIRVRDLLTHRVGFADPDYLWGTSGLDFATIARRLRLVPVQTSFRSRFQYNNVTYALAGDVAAHAAGTTWQSLLHARILGPLGMTETLADASELRGISDVTAPHGIVRDTVRVLPAALDGIDDIAPAGAIFSTAIDMAKWLRFVLDSGKVGGRRLVSAPNFAELFRPQQIVQRPFYPTARLTHPLERYAGTYADSLYGTATVGLTNGRLTLQAGTATGQLEHWQYDVFRVTWPDPFWDPTYLAFVIAPDGSVGELRFVDGGSYRRVR